MTVESKVKARQGVSRCSGRKWVFSYLEERFGGEVTLML